MISLYTLFIVMFSNFILSQHVIFDQLITKNQIKASERLGHEYAETFTEVFYYKHSNFKLNQDLIINLPNNRQIVGEYEKTYTYKNGSYSASYKILNEPYAELVFSKYNNVLSGMYIGENLEKIIFTQTNNNIVAVAFLDEIKLIEEELNTACFTEVVEDSNMRGVNHANICLEESTCSGMTTIDIMVVYTPAARLAWGGTALTLSNMATVISNLNQSMSLSGIANVDFNIVHTHEVDYVESGSQSTDLTRLRGQTDGFMDEIHALRDQYGADLVVMINGDTGGGCGIGNLNTSTTNYNSSAAFSVTRFGCAVGNLTVAHEIGHNMGLRHDWFVDSNVTPCSHHHGYVNQTAINLGTSSTSSQRWRTIMSYNNQCSNAGFTCTRLNRWSNPDLIHNGDFTGVPIGDIDSSDEAYAFRRMACVVANFRTPLSAEVYNLDQISIYPNPVQSLLNIDSTIDNLEVEIFNVMGQKILKSNENTINVENLSSGVYLVLINNELSNSSKTLKFIKE